MTDPLEVAHKLMGIELICGKCKFYSPVEGRKDGRTCRYIKEENLVFYHTLSCENFVPRASGGNSVQ